MSQAGRQSRKDNVIRLTESRRLHHQRRKLNRRGGSKFRDLEQYVDQTFGVRSGRGLTLPAWNRALARDQII